MQGTLSRRAALDCIPSRRVATTAGRDQVLGKKAELGMGRLREVMVQGTQVVAPTHGTGASQALLAQRFDVGDCLRRTVVQILEVRSKWGEQVQPRLAKGRRRRLCRPEIDSEFLDDFLESLSQQQPTIS